MSDLCEMADNLKSKTLTESLSDITRVEVIDGTGRAFVRYLEEDEQIEYSVQDNGRTMKVFINMNFEKI